MERQTTHVVTREEIDLDAMLDEAARAVQRVSAAGKDTKALTQAEREATLAGLSRALGLNPLTNSVRFLPMQGGEVLYVTRQATDQIAARLRLNRETLVGPEVRDVAGTKMVFCQVRVTDLARGRSEVATATLPLRDPANDLMKCETKAKRRATLSIAGLGLLTEEETETIPGVLPAPALSAPPSSPLETWRADLADATTCADVRAAFAAWRADLGDDGARTAVADVRAWCDRSGVLLDGAGVTAMLSTLPLDALRCLDVARSGDLDGIVTAGRVCRGAGWDDHSTRTVWSALARSYAAATGARSVKVAAEALRAACEDAPPPDGTDGPSGPRSDREGTATGEGSSAPSAGTGDAPAALAHPEAWRLSAHGITAHVAGIGNISRLANSARRHRPLIAEVLRTHAVHEYAGRLRVLSRREETDDRGDRRVTELPHEECVERAETWLREGPKVATIAKAPRRAA